MEKIYLDYAATTPVDSAVEKTMKPYFSERFGNPNSLHFFGQEARAAIDLAREKIAKSIGADFGEIIFTGSATEANNLALRGLVKFLNNSFKKISPLRIIVSAIEHESILETARDLEREDVEVVILPVNKNGIVDLKKLKEALNEKTILVSIMYANNETGVIQPLFEIRKIIDDFKKRNFQSISNEKPINQLTNSSIYPLFHTDAVQAFQFLNCGVDDLGVDLMTLSAHKIYGPKGIGALYARNLQPTTNNQQLKAIITGGEQEFGLRSGTENVSAIVGFAKAVELAAKNRDKEAKRILDLKNYFQRGLNKIYPKAQINGIMNYKSRIMNTLPNIINIYFPDFKSEYLLIKLDLNGIAVSSGSACVSFSAKPSHVLEALGYKEERIKSSLRFSFGKFTTKNEINAALKIIKKVLK